MEWKVLLWELTKEGDLIKILKYGDPTRSHKNDPYSANSKPLEPVEGRLNVRTRKKESPTFIIHGDVVQSQHFSDHKEGCHSLTDLTAL